METILVPLRNGSSERTHVTVHFKPHSTSSRPVMSSSKANEKTGIKEQNRVISKKQHKPTKEPPALVKVGHPLYNVQTKKVVLRSGFKRGQTLTLTSAHLVLTPINLLNPKTEFAVMAKNDYLLEWPKFYSGEQYPLWDDTNLNRAAVGDAFFFCHNQVKQGRDLAEMFFVKKKLSSAHRPSHWLIPEHGNRSVLVLSKYVGYCTVTDIMVATGSRPSHTEGVNCLRGTVRRVLKNELVVYRESLE